MSKEAKKTKADSTKNEYNDFDFMGNAKYFGAVSVILLIASVVLFMTKGLNYGIDFSGGSEVQVLFKNNVGMSKVRDALQEAGLKPQLQSIGDKSEYIIRFDHKEVPKDEKGNIQLEALTTSLEGVLFKSFGKENTEFRRIDNVGPQVGSQLKRNAILALFYGLLAILIYTALRFDYNYAPGAVLCLFHDALLTMGVLSLINAEVNVQIVAAILTIVGYSINDTIVIFDRIREDLAIYKDKSLPWIINRAINSTLSRTVITSGLTFISVLTLYLIGQGVIKEFAFAMGLGIILGTYSSIYIAAPMIILFEKFKTVK